MIYADSNVYIVNFVYWKDHLKLWNTRLTDFAKLSHDFKENNMANIYTNKKKSGPIHTSVFLKVLPVKSDKNMCTFELRHLLNKYADETVDILMWVIVMFLEMLRKECNWNFSRSPLSL